MANQKGRKHKASKKNYYASYDYVGQKRKRLMRLAKLQPNNEQIKEALKSVKEYGKGNKKPNTKLGWVNKQTFLVGTVELTGVENTKRKPFQNVSLSQRSVNGRHEARGLVFMNRIINKAQKQFEHNTNFNSQKKKD